MYRVLIADDESIIREGIKCLFDWESLGYTIAGEAANGETAYQQILALQPDIVLLDIRMPDSKKCASDPQTPTYSIFSTTSPGCACGIGSSRISIFPGVTM